MTETLAAIRTLEAMVLEVSGIALRYGSLYGPGTSLPRILGAKPPRRIPVWLGKLFAGEWCRS